MSEVEGVKDIRAEDSYRPGEILLYCEGGTRDRVKVLENNSDESQLVYTLEVLESFEDGKWIVPEKAETFSCTRERNTGYWGMWYLREEDD